jgi:hypothetical protein
VPVPAGLAAAALLALAGCGGSGAQTKAGYIKQVNPLCETEQNELNQVALRGTKLLVKISEAIQIRERANNNIAAVKHPASEPITPQWLELRTRALSASKKIAAAPVGSAESRRQNAVLIRSGIGAQRIALAYGLTQCRGFAAF